MYIFHTFYRDVTVNHCKTLLHAFQCTLGTALKYKQYSGITLETETHVKCVKITLNIFAVWMPFNYYEFEGSPLKFISPNCEMQPCRRPTLLNLEHNSSPIDLYLDFVSSFISNQTTKKSLDSNLNSNLNSVLKIFIQV